MMHDAEVKSQWAEEVEDSYRQHVNSLWRAADLLVWGLDHLASTSDDRATLLSEVSEQLERSVDTLKNWVTTARRWPEEKRRGLPLTLSHHAVVNKYNDEEAYRWLDTAAAHGWGENRLRLEMKAKADPDELLPLTDPLAIQRQFYRMGVAAKLAKRSCKFETPAGILVVSSESDMTWSLLED